MKTNSEDGGSTSNHDAPVESGAADYLSLKMKPVKEVASGWQSGLRVVSGLTFLSRLLGLARDIGMAITFGNGMVMDAFSVAFRIPNLTRRLFGEGALTASFLPIFIRTRENKGPDSGWQVASAVLNLLMLVLLLLVIFAELLLFFMKWSLNWSPAADLLIGLTMVMLPYLVLICVAAQVCAILQSLEHFTWPALLPVILNIVWIAMIWLMGRQSFSAETKIYWIATGIVIAGVFQLLAPLPQLQSLGFRYTFGWRQASQELRLILATLVPVLIGLSITQLNAIADSLIAWSFARPEDGPEKMTWLWNWHYPLESGSAAALYFGQRMYQFPLGVFGVALGTVLFPRFSQHAAQSEIKKLQRDLLLGLKLVIGIGLPASLGLILIAHPLTSLLFQHGAFTSRDANQTAQMISAYAIGIWSYCGLLIVHRAYYALDDQRTPLRIGLLAVAMNLFLNFSLIWILGAAGLALATALSAIVQLMICITLLEERVDTLLSKDLFIFLLKSALATIVMYVVGWLVLYALPESSGLGNRMLRALIPVGVCAAVYIIASQMLRMRELSLLWQSEQRGDSEG